MTSLTASGLRVVALVGVCDPQTALMACLLTVSMQCLFGVNAVEILVEPALAKNKESIAPQSTCTLSLGYRTVSDQIYFAGKWQGALEISSDDASDVMTSDE